MKLTARDFPKLGLQLLAAIFMFIVAALLVWGSQIESGKAERERHEATAARNQIEHRLRQVRIEEQDIKERAQLLQQLQNAGLIGEEKRLDWMEGLRDIQHQMRIPGMNYEFGVQTGLDKIDKSDIVAYNWYSSSMRVQLRVLHEEDLLNFLDRVQKSAKALVIIRSCKLAPLPRQADARQGLAELGAECEMQWLTARRTNTKK
jgi:hypothetical protein